MPRLKNKVFAVVLCGALTGLPLGAVAAAGPALTGGGHFLFAGEIDVTFSFSAVLHNDGTASGSFHHSFEFDGHQIDYFGTLTCAVVDAANGRAWLAGDLTKVSSTHPDVVELPGDDAWFRVLDTGPGGSAAEPDRSTMMGFKGSAGIDTSEQYCAAQLWADGNARTWPVTAGNLTVNR